MPYTVTIKQDNLPDGAEVFINGLGTFKNGESAEVSDEQAEVFRTMNSRPVDTRDKDGNVLVGNYVNKLGPSLEELDVPGMTVKKSTKRAKKKEPQDEEVPVGTQEQQDAAQAELVEEIDTQRDPHQMDPEEVAEAEPVERDETGAVVNDEKKEG